MSIIFGPGGNSEQYYDDGHKSSLDNTNYVICAKSNDNIIEATINMINECVAD